MTASEHIHFQIRYLIPNWDYFYPERKKIIPHNIQSFLHDPLSLAVWFMDDGYKRSDCNALRLGTDSFTKDEQYLL